MDRAARPTRHVARRRLRNRCLLFASSVALLAGLLPSASVEAAAPAAAPGHRVPATAAGSGLQPTIQYEEALAHASDRIAFAPGDRVRIPFAPRAGDRWQVGGVTPRILPAGRASGKTMRLPDGTPVPVRPTPPDQPTVPAADVQAADPATWSATDGAGTIQLAAAVDPGALQREVFGFLPYWELASSTTTFDWEALSTVAYFGVGADGAGNLMKRNADGSTTVGWSGWTSSRMTSVINAAHANHTRVVLTVQSFAWSTGGQNRQKALLGSPTARSRLASQIVAAVRDRGADGVNLDFEPIATGYADDFTAFVRLLRARLDASARGYQLTFDTTGFIGNYPIEAATAPGGADAIFIMGYDYRTAGSSPVGSVAPIGGPRYDITETIAAYAARVSPSKLILGVPYYGRAWSTSTATLNAANISGTKYGASVTATYENAIALAAQYGRQYDRVEGVAWTVYRRQNCTAAYGCVNPWRELYYDDATALSAKYALVNRYGLRGAGIWALGYDGTRPELYQALKDSFILDTIPPKVISTSLSSPIISPNGDRVLDTTTAVMRTTGLIRWGYLINPVSGTTVGSPLRTGSYAGKNPAYVWDGTGNAGKAPDGRYLITLWAADASNNRTQRQFPVTVDTRPAVASVGVGAGWLSPDGDGRRDTAPITWTADERLSGVTRVYNASGTPVRTWRFTGLTAWGTTWTGKDDLGRIVPDGRYVARLDGRDRAGNRTTVDRTINVDRTIRSVRWSASAFDPRARQTSRVTYTLSRRATVNVAIYRGTVLVRQITAGRVLLAGTYGWTWNGKAATGAYMAPGTYRAVVVATSWIGTTAYSQSVIIRTH